MGKLKLPKEYTRYRVFLFFSAFFGYGCYIVNRTSYTSSMPAIMEELDLAKDKMGIIASSFALSYALSKVVVGVLSDNLGPKFIFAGGLAVSGVVNLAFGYSTSLYSMAFLWLVNGLVQGCGWPPVAKLIKTWVLEHESGRWWSTISTSINLAAGLQAMISGNIILLFGWRCVFYVSGLIAFAVSLFIVAVTQNSPKDVNLPTLEELGSMQFDANKHDSKKETANLTRELTTNDSQQVPKFWTVFSDYFLWIISIGYLLVYAIRVVLCDAGWGLLYLIQEKNVSRLDAADAMGSFQLGGMVGSLLVGFISDFLVMKFPNLGVYARVPVLCFATSVLAITLHILRNSASLSKVSDRLLKCNN
jgi:sugar phosphate permease